MTACNPCRTTPLTVLLLACAIGCGRSAIRVRSPEAVVRGMFAAFADDDTETAKALVSVDLAARIEGETGFDEWVKSYGGHALVSVDGPPSFGPSREWGRRATLPATWQVERGGKTTEESGEIKLMSPDGKVWYWEDL